MKKILCILLVVVMLLSGVIFCCVKFLPHVQYAFYANKVEPITSHEEWVSQEAYDEAVEYVNAAVSQAYTTQFGGKVLNSCIDIGIDHDYQRYAKFYALYVDQNDRPHFVKLNFQDVQYFRTAFDFFWSLDWLELSMGPSIISTVHHRLLNSQFIINDQGEIELLQFDFTDNLRHHDELDARLKNGELNEAYSKVAQIIQANLDLQRHDIEVTSVYWYNQEWLDSHSNTVTTTSGSSVHPSEVLWLETADGLVYSFEVTDQVAAKELHRIRLADPEGALFRDDFFFVRFNTDGTIVPESAPFAVCIAGEDDLESLYSDWAINK